MLDEQRDIDPWFSDGLIVGESKIHGMGLFTTFPISSGAPVLRLGGSLFTNIERRSERIMPSTTTPLSETVILAEVVQGQKDLSDHLNHSCDPNVGFTDALNIVAIRTIQENTEITIDYTFWESDSAWKLRRPCNCGYVACRGNVTGTDWKRIQPSDMLFKFYSPFIRRRIRVFAEGGTIHESK
jgi:hypothetical protein